MTIPSTMPIQSRFIWVTLSIVMFVATGCRTADLAQDESKESGTSAEPDEDSHLLRDQNRLKQLYMDLLHLDLDQLMEQSMNAAAVYGQELDKFLTSQGITNRVAIGDVHALHVAEEDFRKTHGHILCEGNSPIAIVWECWANFANAESCFTVKMSAAKVSPADALAAFTLSNRHRRAIGQWECRMKKHSFPFSFTSYPYSETQFHQLDPVDAKRLIAGKRHEARQLLEGFHVNAGSNPHTFKLASLAREELNLSERAESDQQLASAYQWAADAVITAQSAKRLHELETPSTR